MNNYFRTKSDTFRAAQNEMLQQRLAAEELGGADDLQSRYDLQAEAAAELSTHIQHTLNRLRKTLVKLRIVAGVMKKELRAAAALAVLSAAGVGILHARNALQSPSTPTSSLLARKSYAAPASKFVELNPDQRKIFLEQIEKPIPRGWGSSGYAISIIFKTQNYILRKALIENKIPSGLLLDKPKEGLVLTPEHDWRALVPRGAIAP